MEADSIYILNNGSFMVYSCISFPWINDYIEYIDYSEKNILQFLIENKNVKIDVLTKILQDFYNIYPNPNSKILQRGFYHVLLLLIFFHS